MGASTDYRRYRADLGTDTIKEMWASAVESSLYEDGHSYSGQIGMLGPKVGSWHDLNFPKSEQAYEYIATNQEKWRPAIAVSFTENGVKYWLIGGWCSS